MLLARRSADRGSCTTGSSASAVVALEITKAGQVVVPDGQRDDVPELTGRRGGIGRRWPGGPAGCAGRLPGTVEVSQQHQRGENHAWSFLDR
jgi:hypothetical protein